MHWNALQWGSKCIWADWGEWSSRHLRPNEWVVRKHSWENKKSQIGKYQISSLLAHTEFSFSRGWEIQILAGVDFWCRSGGDRDPIFVSGSCFAVVQPGQQPLFELIHVSSPTSVKTSLRCLAGQNKQMKQVSVSKHTKKRRGWCHVLVDCSTQRARSFWFCLLSTDNIQKTKQGGLLMLSQVPQPTCNWLSSQLGNLTT